ncbi:PD-(D/E)XK nuclease-like domain-containing protein [Pleomorphomonas oryzae]|uniref:PD-(D/E)XK nuclease-like domain-containing protein n=1 Tax=Pleomorphomonas oryzae TaxID=261934 RepID=UPI00042448F8|nr:PD-(D/E)XK nuclease-like domain-containing protein [Pleomorphomonas oryzae]
MITLNPNAPAPVAPGVYLNLSNEAYHHGPGISKSGLAIMEQSPMHFRAPEKPKTKLQQQALDFGSAFHIAVLEPERFDAAVLRGPIDRRGNKWDDAEAYCKSKGMILLTEGDHDKVQTMRDVVHSDNEIHNIITRGKPMAEMSVYWEREYLYTPTETGEEIGVPILCKCRTDLYRQDLDLVLDLKSAEDASKAGFAKAIANQLYHMQEAWYEGGLSTAGIPSSFCFLAVEKEPPYAFDLYEIPPSFYAEGLALAERAFARYADCLVRNEWPGYRKPGDTVKELSFPRWAYKLTKAPDDADADV